MENKSKKTGKIGYFNSLTGYIIYNDEMIPFHKKDCLHLFDDNQFTDEKMVEFDLEKNDYGLVARNIELKEETNDNTLDEIKISYKN